MTLISIKFRSRLMCLSWGVALLTLPCASISAAEKNDKQERATQRRIQQMQQIQQTLEQENATLKQQIKDLEAKLAAGQSILSKQKQSVSKLQTQNSEQDTLLSTCQSTHQATRSELEVTLAQKNKLSDESNKEKARLESALSQQKYEVNACQEKNANLIKSSVELIKKYEKKALSGVEPLTGLKGIEIENNFQDYRDQAESQSYKQRK